MKKLAARVAITVVVAGASCSNNALPPQDGAIDAGTSVRRNPAANVDGGTDLPSVACVPGQYRWGCATDCAPGQFEPQCGTAVPTTQSCQFRGISCEYFGVTLACDCDGVLHC